MYEVNQAGLLCRVRSKGKQGSLGFDMQIVVPERLRGQVIEGCHQGTEGHGSVLKTFQKARERFYWPGMFGDVQRYVKYCAQCSLNSAVHSKAPITKHIEATGPGETWVMDLLHFPNAKGFKYALVCIDAYSRWAEAEPLEDKCAATVADALVRSVITNTAGHPKLLISDQGSEFKGDLADAVKMLRVTQRYTAAYRSEGHGLAERYNRAIADKLKSMVSQNDPQWHRALPWAKLAHNNSVHRALSMGGEGITPAEVQLGRRLPLNVEAGLAPWSAMEGNRSPSEYAAHMAEHVKATQEWVAECRAKYQRAMRLQANKSGKKLREFSEGDSVRLKAVPSQGRTGRKLLNAYEGPFTVVKRDNEVEYTIQKVGEGKKIKFQVHIDRLAKYEDLMELDTRQTETQQAAQPHSAEYEVEDIIDDTGSRKSGTKSYRVRWKGYEAKDDTWQPLADLVHCSQLIERYELRKVGVYYMEQCPWPATGGTAVFAVTTAAQPRAITIAMDLNGTETPEQMLDSICEKAGVLRQDIVFAWASPPCESYSRANWSNLSRGFNHRKPEPGLPPVDGPKGEIAAAHDRLAQRVKAVLQIIQRYVMENPRGGMEKMWFMADMEDKKRIVELCAYAWPFRKSTNLWTNGFTWNQQGNTGSGRCNDSCDQGALDPLTKRFRHFMALAVDPERGPRGPGAARMTCGIPNMLIKEILTAVSEQVSLGGKVVLDLCAGFQSIREEVLKAGATYVAVDLHGARVVKNHRPRRVAVVLECNGKVLVVQSNRAYRPNVTRPLLFSPAIRSWIVGGTRNSTDTSLHSAGVRHIQDKLGLPYHAWQPYISKGPTTYAMHDTTYYIYNLNQCIPKALLEGYYQKRVAREAHGNSATWGWVDVATVDARDGMGWRPEDVAMLTRYAQAREMRGGC